MTGNFLIRLLQAWEIQTSMYSFYIHPFTYFTLGALVHSVTLTLLLILMLASIFCWLADSFLGQSSSVPALGLPKTLPVTGATVSLLPDEKQVLTSDEDRPREGRPWQKSSPSCPTSLQAGSQVYRAFQEFPFFLLTGKLFICNSSF